MGFRAPAGVRALVCAAALAMIPAAASGETIFVPAGGNLQAAIDRAQGGDVIALEPGATYVGNFVLRNKPDVTIPIVIRSSAPDSMLPAAGVRMTPAYAPLLPKIKSPNSMPALKTSTAAHHWTIQFVEFQANQKGYSDIIALGAGDSTQTDLSQVPYALVLDRLYIHGDPVLGQKRGIALHSAQTAIINSHISDCKGVGQDTQAISGYNGPGGYLIENNHLEGAGENFMIGGADPKIPDLVPSDIVFRRNHLYKPIEWRNPIVPSVEGVSAQGVPGGGGLPAGTYTYTVVARRMSGQTNVGVSDVSALASATVAAGSAVAISWQPVTGAHEYIVYGRTASALNVYWKTTAPYFIDNGAAGASGKPAKPTRWVVKNLFELKSGQDILVEGNVFENLWVADQSGYAIALTPRNQDGRAPWTVLQRVMFRDNLVRHTAGGVNILGRDNLAPSLQTNNIAIHNNLFEDMTAALWGSGSRFLIIGDGPDAISVQHNTVITTNASVVWLYGGPSSSPTLITNSRYMDNMFAHNRYGIMGQGYVAGTASIAAYMPDGIVSHNAIAGGKASSYPANNYFPAGAEWESGFMDYAAGDYRLKDSSPYKNAGSDGKDLGADVVKVRAEAAIALSGDNSPRPGPDPIQIITSTLRTGTFAQPYDEMLSCSGGSGQCGWLVRDGSLQDGLTLDQYRGEINGTPSTVDTRALTFEAYDIESPQNRASKMLTLAIGAPELSVVLAPPPVGEVGTPYRIVPTVTGAVGVVSWTLSSGALPAGLWLDGATGAVEGLPSAWGAATFRLEARDSWDTTRVAGVSATVTIAPAPLAVPSGPLAPAPVDKPYAAVLTAIGGSGSVSWTVADGTLPPGVTLDPTGLVAGTPTQSGAFTFSARAIDLNWAAYNVTGTFMLTVEPADVSPPMPAVPSAPDIVLHASAAKIAGTWERVADATAASGYRVWNPDMAAPKILTALAAPLNYLELTFSPHANVPYRLWIRGRADKNYWGNDSMFVQFSDAVDANGAPALRLGTTSATVVSIEEGSGAGVAGWGWGDNGYGGVGQPIVFGTAGPQTVRIQVREDGLSIDQIVLSPATYFTDAPGTAKNDTTILPSTEIVLYAADASTVAGAWWQVPDATAAGGLRLWNVDRGAPKLLTPLAAPVNFFDVTFEAAAGVPYHVWVRGKADRNSWANDSVYVQFSNAVDTTGAAIHAIGTTAAMTVSIEDGMNAGLRGWGWQDNAFGVLGAPVVFGASGAQTIRVQVREDGLSIDQIVLSVATHAAAAPGTTKDDTTVLLK